MRSSRTLAWSIARETSLYTAIGFLAITALLVSQNLLQRLDAWTAAGFTLRDFAIVLRCLAPMLTAYSLPIAFLLGVMVACRRIAADGEWVAMRSCGLGLSAVLAPVLALAALASLLSGWLVIDVEHEARRDLLTRVKTVVARGGALEAGVFRGIGSRVIFVRERDRTNRLEGVMVDDRSDPANAFTIFAERGRFELDESTGIAHLRLEAGDLLRHTDPAAPARTARLRFDALDYAFDLGAMLRLVSEPTRPKQMRWSELDAVLERAARGDSLHGLDELDPVQYALEKQRRLASPASPLLFALIGVPLGLRRSRGARALAVVLCAGLLGAYFGVGTFTQFLATRQWLSPAAAHWLPALLLLLGSAPLLRRAQRGLDG